MRNLVSAKNMPGVGMAAAALLLPVIVTDSYLLTLICQVVTYAIVALGINFITGLAGQMNLGSAAIFGLGSYTSALVSTRLGVNPWLALVVAIVVGVIIGYALGYPSLRVKGVYLSITTIAFCEIVRLLLINLEKWTGGVQGVRNIPPYQLFGITFNTPQTFFYLILFVFLVLILVARFIIRSKYGRAFIAVRDNADALETCGIDIASIKVKSFLLASVYATVAGAMYAHFVNYINPTTYTTDLSINFVVMLMIGGMGSIWGVIIGAVIVTLLPELLRFVGNYYQLVYAIIMMSFIIFVPGGIVSLGKKLWHKKQKVQVKQG